MRKNIGGWYAIGAAVLFGASTPAAKPLLSAISPLLAAGLLYFGSGIGLCVMRLLRRGASAAETPLGRGDWPWMAGSTLLGGICGPVLLMTGLARTSAASASLLLNLEAVFTALLAWLAFREHASRRTVLGMVAILVGAVVLGWSGQTSWQDTIGPLCIGAACLAWALDNNLTRKIAGSDPLEIASLKSLVAGAVNIALACGVAHAALPGIGVVVGAAAIGYFGYGLSLVLFLFALRHIGTARTSAYFSTAPFVGAVIALAVGLATPDPRLFVTAALMGFGVWLHATETHEHEHTHDAFEHEHLHVHDEHHQHTHDAGVPAGEPHAHRHVHAVVTHSHPHFPDLHHGHVH